VDFAATLAHSLLASTRLGPVIRRVASVIKDFDPHLILSDYEYITARAAQLMGRPCISLDNQHLLTNCLYDPPPGERLNRYLTCFFIRRLVASRYLITSFLPLPPADRTRTEVFPPLIKPKVMDLQPTTGDYAIVYLRGYNYGMSMKLLSRMGRKFVIYGQGERPDEGMLHFKKTSEDDFLADLAGCRYVIANGGHSLITEALYLGKPILCLPVQFFYEQFFNAYFLEKYGFGQFSLDIDGRENFIHSFEERLGEYRRRIQEYNFLGNRQITARLEELIRN
jgi:uncharacterized protein (TIGR00661 family)